MTLEQILSNKQLQPIINVGTFSILIVGFHFFFRWWARGEDAYWPLEDIVIPVYKFLSNLLYENSVWTLKHFTNYKFTTNTELREIYIGGGYVGVTAGCSGLKQFLHWIFLMTIFPGPWKQKLWFIPAGLLIIHLVNIFRISSLTILLYYDTSQSQWDFAHDYLLRPIFFVVMFALWVFWVERFVNKK